MGDMTISYQLYSSRKFGPLPRTLRMLADAGYGAVEGHGALYRSEDEAKSLRLQLDDAGLAMPTGHFPLDLVEGDPDRAIAMARALGIGTVYVPFLMPGARPSDAEGWRALAVRLAEAGKPLRDAGLGYGWHNHDFELRPTPDGAVPMELILEAGDLDWEMDVAWVVRGGADPMDWIDRFGPRIRAVHVKDIAPEGEKADEDGWADPGTGTMDWAALAARLSQLDVAHWVMEHDNPSDDARFARAAMGAARRIEGMPG